jgi:ABC-2 type transport system ATP-binding protein
VAIIEVDQLRRTYRLGGGFRRRGTVVEAVRGVSFEVERGQLFGLLGPNGAGKTSIIKMLVTLLEPTSGTAKVLGYDTVRQVRQVRSQVGYVFGGDRGLYLRVSARDNLRYFAELYGVSGRRQRQRIDEILEIVGLTGRENEPDEGYSRGMRQRLHIARGLLHDPPVVFLDEPTIGVDPVGARQLRSTISALVGGGKTVVLTTHYMLEADALCDWIVVLNGGQIVGSGTPSALKEAAAGVYVVEVETDGVPDEHIEHLRALPGISSVSVDVRGQWQVLQVHSRSAGDITTAVVDRLHGVRLGQVTVREPTLEDAYVALVSTGPQTTGPQTTGPQTTGPR